MSLRSQFKTSPKLETEGIWLELGNTRIRLARAGGQNQKYNAAMEKISKIHRRAIENELLSSEKSLSILREVYADTVVLDWETNIGTEDDSKWVEGIEPETPGDDLLPVTRENIIATFKELPDLFLECKRTAEKMMYFSQSLIDGAVKN